TGEQACLVLLQAPNEPQTLFRALRHERAADWRHWHTLSTTRIQPRQPEPTAQDEACPQARQVSERNKCPSRRQRDSCLGNAPQALRRYWIARRRLVRARRLASSERRLPARDCRGSAGLLC